MSAIHRIYYILHRMFTPDSQRSSGVSPGYWNHLVRSAVLGCAAGAEGNILDVGCGDGLFLSQLAKQNPGARLWAVDIDGDNISQAREKARTGGITRIYFSQQDALDLSFKQGIFDMIVCTNVLMTMDSMESVRKALVSMSRVCRKGATICFDYRNASNPLVRLKYRLAPMYDSTIKRRNVNAYRPDEISRALSEARMSVISRQCIGLPLLRDLAPVVIIKAQKI